MKMPQARVWLVLLLGVAAIIRSYFPELSASEVREVLMRTVEHSKKGTYPGLKIKQKLVKFVFLEVF